MTLTASVKNVKSYPARLEEVGFTAAKADGWPRVEARLAQNLTYLTLGSN